MTQTERDDIHRTLDLIARAIRLKQGKVADLQRQIADLESEAAVYRQELLADVKDEGVQNALRLNSAIAFMNGRR